MCFEKEVVAGSEAVKKSFPKRRERGREANGETMCEQRVKRKGCRQQSRQKEFHRRR